MAKILVIDDHAEILTLFAEVLAEAGHEVITAPAGALGLALYDRHRPVIVITDLVLPSISGIEVIEHLRGQRGVQIIAISRSGGEHLGLARAVGATVTFKKPFSIRELTAAVRRLVGEGAGSDGPWHGPSIFGAGRCRPTRRSEGVPERKRPERGNSPTEKRSRRTQE